MLRSRFSVISTPKIPSQYWFPDIVFSWRHLWAFVVVVVTMTPVVKYLIIALIRMPYPYALEWMEGASLVQVHHILAGHALYGPPSIEFTAMIYPPLYYYLSAALASVMGDSFLPLRLVSFIASLGCFVFIFRLVNRHTGSIVASGCAVSLFAATYRLGGAWLDVARVDTLLLLCLLAILDSVPRIGHQTAIIGGVWCCLAFLTKQTAILAIVPLLTACLFIDWRRGLLMSGVALSLIVFTYIWFNIQSFGWYHFYLFTLPALHRPSTDVVTLSSFWIFDIFEPLGISMVMALYGWILHTRQANMSIRSTIVASCIGVGFLGISWAGRSNPGGYDNVLLPAHAIISIAFGVGIHFMCRYVSVGVEPFSRLLFTVLVVAGVFQFALLHYPAAEQIPNAADRAAGERLVQLVREVPGPVYISMHPELALFAGKPSYAPGVALSELWGAWGEKPSHHWTTVRSELLEALRQRQFGAVITDDVAGWLDVDIGMFYRKQHSLNYEEGVFEPVTGWTVRPKTLYVPNNNAIVP